MTYCATHHATLTPASSVTTRVKCGIYKSSVGTERCRILAITVRGPYIQVVAYVRPIHSVDHDDVFIKRALNALLPTI